jgi:hypothetical protein
MEIKLYISPEEKKDENIFLGQIDTNEIIASEEKNLTVENTPEHQLFDALKLLKKIIKKEEPKETFPKLVDIFMASEFNRNRRYALGHLLVEYYGVIEQDSRVIALLQMKDKTNLSKDICY